MSGVCGIESERERDSERILKQTPPERRAQCSAQCQDLS